MEDTLITVALHLNLIGALLLLVSLVRSPRYEQFTGHPLTRPGLALLTLGLVLSGSCAWRALRDAMGGSSLPELALRAD